MTIQIFLSFWQKVSPHLEFPLTQAGDDASYNSEWEGKDFLEDCKFQGMRKADDQKHGIVRTIYQYCIEEATWYEDKRHGLCFFWDKDNNYSTVAFRAYIFDHGQMKARISWNDDWSEYGSDGDKELILGSNGLSIFKK